MFCPTCKAEYREGFTHCADCDVDLVESLASTSSSGELEDSGEAVDLDAPELLWSGVDVGTFEQIRSALDEANIPYNDERLEARLLYRSLGNPLEIWVQRQDRTSARKILTDLFTAADQTAQPDPADAASQQDIQLPENQGWDAEGDAARGSVLDFDPEEAAVEIWTGEAGGMAPILKDCLRENGIGCAIVPGPKGEHLRVYPADEVRAREIVREVVEGVPPE
ncbi:MAG TPA: hypothetical protein VG033_02335 [Candidatus Acidoferrales bacterium]|jgi:hypothetical protein|nr:hypothetical protein [Candidatus Acidoferrales bacterium]